MVQRHLQHRVSRELCRKKSYFGQTALFAIGRIPATAIFARQPSAKSLRFSFVENSILSLLPLSFSLSFFLLCRSAALLQLFGSKAPSVPAKDSVGDTTEISRAGVRYVDSRSRIDVNRAISRNYVRASEIRRQRSVACKQGSPF